MMYMIGKGSSSLIGGNRLTRILFLLRSKFFRNKTVTFSICRLFSSEFRFAPIARLWHSAALLLQLQWPVANLKSRVEMSWNIHSINHWKEITPLLWKMISLWLKLELQLKCTLEKYRKCLEPWKRKSCYDWVRGLNADFSLVGSLGFFKFSLVVNTYW